MCRVFLIDNNLNQQTYNTRILDELGYEVTAFSDPVLALEALEENEEPDVIFVSFDLPRMYNTEYFNLIMQARPYIPIVITTLSPFPSPEILRRTPHVRYRLFGRLRKESVQWVLQTIFASRGRA